MLSKEEPCVSRARDDLKEDVNDVSVRLKSPIPR